jgi:hypothetical protein
MTAFSPADVPRFREVFNALKLGVHVSVATPGGLYESLKDHEAVYRELFAAIGYPLVKHPRGFYHLVSTGEKAASSTTRMAVFMLAVIEHLADEGADPEVELHARTFALDEMPHLSKDRYRRWMRELRVETPHDLDAIVAALCKFGFAERIEPDQFAFLTPVTRFIDLCVAANAEKRRADIPEAAASPRAGEGTLFEGASEGEDEDGFEEEETRDE